MPRHTQKATSPKSGEPKKIGRPKSKGRPAGYVKIHQALKSLLAEKGFQDITWGGIATTAGVSEALIYQYFKTRSGLLYSILADYLEKYKARIRATLDEEQGALNKVKALIDGLLSVYDDDRVFARVLLLEVRNIPDYYESEAYALVRDFGDMCLETIQAGVASGEIRSDVEPTIMRQSLLGTVEHAILPYVIFQRQANIRQLSEYLNLLFLDAIKARPQ